LYTAWLGWGAWAVGAFSAFLFGGIAGVVVLLRSGGGRKTAIPFGPFMVAGALFAVFAGVPLARAYLHTFG
jgi:leader peptidase (prepilin peptidase)/N-methyltransferase